MAESESDHVQGPRLSRLVKRFGPLSLEQLLPLAVDLAGGMASSIADALAWRPADRPSAAALARRLETAAGRLFPAPLVGDHARM